MTIKIGDKIRMSEKGISMCIPADWVPLGTVGKVVDIGEGDDTVAVEFESDPSNNWWYNMEDAIVDRIQLV